MTTIPQTVFLVDDDATSLVTLRGFLTASHYKVEEFTDGRCFLERMRPDTAGCLLLDLVMPHMNGLEVQAELAASANPLPIIFVTGNSDIPSVVAAMRGGAEDFLLKPALKSDVLRAVERALAKDDLNRQARRRRQEATERLEVLTLREREVLAYVVQGLLNKQIAAILGTVERTVKLHRSNLIAKLKVRTVPELIELWQVSQLGGDFFPQGTAFSVVNAETDLLTRSPAPPPESPDEQPMPGGVRAFSCSPAIDTEEER